LTAQEISKCWDHGVATFQGCFGPNNEIRRFIDKIDKEFKNILGENSEAYKVIHALKDNVLAPGPNHEVVKFLNNGLNDIKNGPGPNNEIVKLATGVGGIVGEIGKALGF
jgi:hypothetical protein